MNDKPSMEVCNDPMCPSSILAKDLHAHVKRHVSCTSNECSIRNVCTGAACCPYPYSKDGKVIAEHANGPILPLRGIEAYRELLNAGDPINPSHYKGDLVMRIIERFRLDFKLGNVIKYILRHQEKAKVEDLKKARWYLDRAIAELEGSLKPGAVE